MTQFGKISVRGLFSANADYSAPDPDTKQIDLALTPTLYLHQRLRLSTVPVTLDLSGFTTITALLLVNRSITVAEVVLATWHNLLGTRPAGDLDITAWMLGGTDDVITDTLAGGAFLAEGARAGCLATIANAEEVANNVTLRIISAAANVLDVISETLVTANAHDTKATMTFTMDNTQRIAPSDGQLLVTSSVLPAGDLKLVSLSGTPEVEVFVLGA